MRLKTSGTTRRKYTDRKVTRLGKNFDNEFYDVIKLAKKINIIFFKTIFYFLIITSGGRGFTCATIKKITCTEYISSFSAQVSIFRPFCIKLVQLCIKNISLKLGLM